MLQPWQPGMQIEMLRARSLLLQTIRQFFAHRDVMEVETPLLSQHTITDIHLHPFRTTFSSPLFSGSTDLYLMTSPEFHMKRLLCAGAGAIYQLGKAFRNEEQGRFHNPEFTMLEWYRPGWDHHELMDEMEQLLQACLACGPCERLSYQEAFHRYVGVDPLSASITTLQHAAPESCAELALREDDKDTLLQLLFSMVVEPEIGQQSPVFIYDFPASQAALARISLKDERVAERFEVYFRGIELANGFHELTDAKEQQQRFEAENQRRQTLGLPVMPVDHWLLEALTHGMPDCAGVALGVDRLFMLQQGLSEMSQAVSFSVDRA